MIKSDFNINGNKTLIMELLKSVERPGMNKVIEYLNKSDFFTAPSSTRFHNNCEGGLAQHCLNVYGLLLKKNKEFNLNLTKENCIIAALLHDVCKIGLYHSTYKNVIVGKKVNYQGKEVNAWGTQSGYEFKDLTPLGHGEKSVIMLQHLGLKLESCEMFMIRWHMGAFDASDSQLRSFQSASELYPCVTAMWTADMEASRFMEKTYEGDIIK